MSKFISTIILCLVLLLTGCKNEPQEQQTPEQEIAETQTATPVKQEPWTQQQLLEPRDLAVMLQSEKDSLLIYSLGAGGIIPGSKDTGPSGEKKGLQNLEKELLDVPRDKEIVIYCGCCPFDICPNVRPAFSLLNEMGFENHQLLNLRDNIKVDWIDRGFPTSS